MNPQNEKVVSVQAVRNLIKRGTSLRVAESAVLELQAILETDGESVARLAVELARRRGAKTVAGIDIRTAAKLVRAPGGMV